MARQSNARFGEAEYRRGAMERLREAETLIRAGHFGGSVYLAGRAVEGMLRAVIWTHDPAVQQMRKPLETGHDLRELLILIRKMGLIRVSGRDDEFEAMIDYVARLWFNNMRFASAKFVESWWWRLGEVHRRRTFKQSVAGYFEMCSFIVKRCEVLCER